MPLSDVLNQEPASVFSDEDRIMHTSKMVERTFGLPADQLGQVEVRDGRAVLTFSHEGQNHTLRWERQPNGAIFWYLDDSPDRIVLGGGERALRRLVNALS